MSSKPACKVRLHIYFINNNTAALNQPVQDGMQSVLPSYRGTLDAMATMVRQEGWRSLYSGLYPAMLGSCTCAANEKQGI